MVGEGFFGISEKLLPSRPEPLHSFFSVAVGAEVSMVLCSLCHNLERQHTHTPTLGKITEVHKRKKQAANTAAYLKQLEF